MDEGTGPSRTGLDPAKSHFVPDRDERSFSTTQTLLGLGLISPFSEGACVREVSDHRQFTSLFPSFCLCSVLRFRGITGTVRHTYRYPVVPAQQCVVEAAIRDVTIPYGTFTLSDNADAQCVSAELFRV